MLQEESVPHGTCLIDQHVPVKISNSVIFAIQVTLEDADDNEHNRYGKSIFFLQLFKLTSFLNF